MRPPLLSPPREELPPIVRRARRRMLDDAQHGRIPRSRKNRVSGGTFSTRAKPGRQTIKKTLVVCVALSLALTAGNGALAAKKKKPKRWKSETVSLGIAHPVVYGSTGQVNSVTAHEFVARCDTPASQGVDGWVFEVPGEYQKINAVVKAVGHAAGPVGYDVDIYSYDADCAIKSVSNAEGTDENGYILAGSAWIFVHNYQGDPNTQAHIELSSP